jgi:iron complex transport system substrate-binding protein
MAAGATRMTETIATKAKITKITKRRKWVSAYPLSFFVLFVFFVAIVSTQSRPTRIISLVPALTEMVFAIGAGPNVVAVSSFDVDPPEVARLPRVGALLDPDVERILSLSPDLVLVYGSQTDLLQQLARAGIQAFSYRHGGLAHVTDTIRTLGQQIGHITEAARVGSDIERRLQDIRARMAGRPRPRTMLVFGRERQALRQIYVSGGRGFLHDLLEVAGGVNAFADIDMESAEVSTETILTRAPEVILELRVTDIPDPTDLAAETASWKPLASVPAVRNGRVQILTGRSLVVAGPRVAETAERMARALHPEAFKTQAADDTDGVYPQIHGIHVIPKMRPAIGPRSGRPGARLRRARRARLCVSVSLCAFESGGSSESVD